MDIKTYFSKSNTIIYESYLNTSQNPVCELYYGDGYTRVLIDIDITKIKNLITGNTFSNKEELTHILKMKNCWGFQALSSNTVSNSGKDNTKERTSSFDLYLLRMPESWDSGIGNDYTKDGFISTNYIVSENGSNWYNSATNVTWNQGPGAITGDTSGNTNNVVAIQHFDIGNEDIEMNITNEINNIIYSGATNNGFMLCFPTSLEDTNMDSPQYVGFFTNKTSTFYQPYIETIYNEDIIDDRNEFYLNKDNRLYLYSLIGGSYTNLDTIPTCSVSGVTYDVKQATKGIYYVDIPSASSSQYEEGNMYYDIWSNIIYNGKTFDNIELEFVAKGQEDYFNFGNASYEQEKYIPTVYGIKYGEKVNRGDIRKVFVNPRVEYTTNTVNHITGMEYRVYVKETNKEITVIDYQPINRALESNFFFLDTESLLPNTYFVDIKITRNDEILTYKGKLNFEIVNEL
jgi:hypothetical protein